MPRTAKKEPKTSPKTKTKSKAKVNVEESEQKFIEQKDIIHRDAFLAEIEAHKMKPVVENGIVYVHVKKEKIEETMQILEKCKEKSNYRGSYGASVVVKQS